MTLQRCFRGRIGAGNPAARRIGFVAPMLVAMLLGGCTGQQQAINVNAVMSDASAKAAKTVADLKAASEAEVKAHQLTRQSFRTLYSAYWTARTQQAVLEMDVSYWQTRNAVDQKLLALLGDLQQKRGDLQATLPEKLKAAFLPADQREAILQAEAESAKDRLVQAVNDVDLKTRAMTTELNYWTWAAAGRQRELVVMADVSKAMDEAYLGERDKLIASCQKQRDRLDDIYNKAKAALLAVQQGGAIDIGPEPASNAEVYDGLSKYIESVNNANHALNNYLVSNSWGSGSYFQEFFKSLGQGFLGGVIHPDGKGADWSQVAQAGKAVFDPLVDNFNRDLSSAGSSIVESLTGLANDAEQRIGRAVNDAVQKQLGTPTKAAPLNVSTTAAH